MTLEWILTFSRWFMYGQNGELHTLIRHKLKLKCPAESPTRGKSSVPAYDSVNEYAVLLLILYCFRMRLAPGSASSSLSAFSSRMLTISLVWLLIVTQFSSLIQAAPAVEERGDNICNTGIYAEWSVQLKGYAPAQNFCKSYYPAKCVEKQKREIGRRAVSTTTRSKDTTVTTTAGKNDGRAEAFSKGLKQAGRIISTLCSCIQPSQVC